MARSVKISKKFLIFLSTGLMLSWITGLTFFSMNRWLTVEGDFGPEKHPLQFSVLKTHGAAAFLMMIAFGYLYASHVSVGWPIKKMRIWGLLVVGAFVFLICSAYGLYYLGDEGFRQFVSYAHFSVGLSLPFLVIVHRFQGRKQRGKRGQKRRRELSEA